MVHFGVRIKEKEDGMELTKENFVNAKAYNYFDKTVLSDEERERYVRNGMVNYDLNMKKYASLDETTFYDELQRFVHKNGFEKVEDLSKYSKMGYYLMVLGNYKQMYIGTSENIRKRIMKHWSTTMTLDRIVLWSPNTSRISIDSFRALDTKKFMRS